MQKEEERMDEGGGGGALLLLHEWNQEDNCLVCGVMTSIQGNHVWLPKEGM